MPYTQANSASSRFNICYTKGIDLVIVLIPTKESVFLEYVRENEVIRNRDVMIKLLSNEEEVRRLTKSYFERYGISYIDVLPNLRNVLPTTDLYPANLDGHLNANGNEITAKAIHKGLEHLSRDAGR